MMKVLILADDCNPEWPSLPIVGYKAAAAVSRIVDVTLVTHVRNKPNIEKAGGCGNCEVVYVDNEYVAKPFDVASKFIRGGDQLGWATAMAMNYVPYLAFEREVWKKFKTDLYRGHYDLVHRLTPMTPTIPSPMASWSPVPFVLGPLNGGLKWPSEHGDVLSAEKDWLTRFKNAYKFLPYHRSTYEKSAAILTAFEHTRAEVPKHCLSRTIDFPEVGYDPSIFYPRKSFFDEGLRQRNEAWLVRQRADVKTQFLYAGRLVPYKMPSLLVECFAKSRILREHKLLIVGSGPEKLEILSLIVKHDLHNCVTVLESMPQREVADRMRHSDAFVFPSIRELGAGVLVEAMASGLPCISIDHGAASTLLAAGRGELVKMSDREQLRDCFIHEMETYARDTVKRSNDGARAFAYVQENLSWDVKARKLAKIYEDTLAAREVDVA